MIEWATAFDPCRVEVTACVLREAGTLGEQLTSRGVPIIYFGDGRFNPISIWKFVKLIREHQIDVLHLQGFGATLFGRIAGLLTGTPAIVHMHSYSEVPGYRFFGRLLDRILTPWTALALAVSKPVKTFCVEQMGFRPEQVEIVHNAAPAYGFAPVSEERLGRLRDRYGLEPDTPVVGTTSRLSSKKGLHVLLEAFVLVLTRLPRARLLVVGDGPERTRLERQAQALDIRHAVIFAGFQHDVAAHLRLFWITAAPSIWEEPCPLSVIESLAAGVPVVASRVGGVPELIAHEETGLLVQYGNVQQLADAISWVLQEPVLRNRLSEKCRVYGERFSLHHHLHRLEALYRKVVRWTVRGAGAVSLPE
jgi:glycosyltransferase involved in cell wall biosynthesis